MVVAMAMDRIGSRPPASPSSRPIAAAPMVWPIRSGGLPMASAVKAGGVIMPVPAPMSTAASCPPSGGRRRRGEACRDEQQAQDDAEVAG